MSSEEQSHLNHFTRTSARSVQRLQKADRLRKRPRFDESVTVLRGGTESSHQLALFPYGFFDVDHSMVFSTKSWLNHVRTLVESKENISEGFPLNVRELSIFLRLVREEVDFLKPMIRMLDSGRMYSPNTIARALNFISMVYINNPTQQSIITLVTPWKTVKLRCGENICLHARDLICSVSISVEVLRPGSRHSVKSHLVPEMGTNVFVVENVYNNEYVTLRLVFEESLQAPIHVFLNVFWVGPFVPRDFSTVNGIEWGKCRWPGVRDFFEGNEFLYPSCDKGFLSEWLPCLRILALTKTKERNLTCQNSLVYRELYIRVLAILHFYEEACLAGRFEREYLTHFKAFVGTLRVVNVTPRTGVYIRFGRDDYYFDQTTHVYLTQIAPIHVAEAHFYKKRLTRQITRSNLVYFIAKEHVLLQIQFAGLPAIELIITWLGPGPYAYRHVSWADFLGVRPTDPVDCTPFEESRRSYNEKFGEVIAKQKQCASNAPPQRPSLGHPTVPKVMELLPSSNGIYMPTRQPHGPSEAAREIENGKASVLPNPYTYVEQYMGFVPLLKSLVEKDHVRLDLLWRCPRPRMTKDCGPYHFRKRHAEEGDRE